MIEVEAKLRRWGNSMGIVVPLSKLKEEDMREGQELRVLLIKKNDFLKSIFGAHKFKEPVKKIMREIDEELYNE
jgi:antitoxin component of MazEF toxin-antitoxin module